MVSAAGLGKGGGWGRTPVGLGLTKGSQAPPARPPAKPSQKHPKSILKVRLASATC